MSDTISTKEAADREILLQIMECCDALLRIYDQYDAEGPVHALDWSDLRYTLVYLYDAAKNKLEALITDE